MTGAFVEHYRDFYDPKDRAHLAWRDACAIDKGQNVIDLWSAVHGGDSPSLVDVGCGDGAVAADLLRRGFPGHLLGVDVSDSGVEIARSRRLANARFETFDGARLSLADREADLAVLSHVVEHVENPRALIREAARVARYVVVEVPLEHNLRHLGDFRWTDTGHVNFYDRSLIRQLVQSCGLIVRAERTSCPGLRYAQERGSARARLKWHVKQGLLTVAPGAATALLTYHQTLIASGDSA